MIIVSDGWSSEKDIKIEEALEPMGACYFIEQGDARICLGNNARVKEIINILRFIASVNGENI